MEKLIYWIYANNWIEKEEREEGEDKITEEARGYRNFRLLGDMSAD